MARRGVIRFLESGNDVDPTSRGKPLGKGNASGLRHQRRRTASRDKASIGSPDRVREQFRCRPSDSARSVSCRKGELARAVCLTPAGLSLRAGGYQRRTRIRFPPWGNHASETRVAPHHLTDDAWALKTRRSGPAASQGTGVVSRALRECPQCQPPSAIGTPTSEPYSVQDPS